MEEKKIDKALKRLDGIPAQYIFRAGKIVKIPAQKIELEVRDGIRIIYEVIEDITEPT